MSLWAFRFLLWYICILCVQPQNRFLFLHPLHIADIAIISSLGLHVMSCLQEHKPIIRFGPATIAAFLLLVSGFISLHMGVFQESPRWNGFSDQLTKSAVVLIMVEAMATSVQRVWAVHATLLFGTLWWIKGGLRLSAVGATYAGDRVMGPAVSLIDNPNGFAYLLCVIIPVYLYFYQQAGGKYLRWALLGIALAAVYIVLQTGSRTGLIILVVTGIFLVPKYGREHKLALVVASVALFGVVSLVSPGNIQRLKGVPKSIRAALRGDVTETDQLDQDEQSAQERRMKNSQTWQLIRKYPLFGVGINPDESKFVEEFPTAGGQVHCEILMAGRQMGFWGMGLYAFFLALMFARGLRVEKGLIATWPAIGDLGWTLKIQAITIAVGGAFSPMPWNAVTFILAGTVSALWGNLCAEGYMNRVSGVRL